MTWLRSIITVPRGSVLLLFPLALWALLWAGVQVGRSFDEDLGGFVNWLLGALPILLAYLAMALLLVKFLKKQEGRLSFFGPLGLTIVYGVVGLAASVFSPDGSVSLYWAGAYLSVPLVLWSIVWGRDGLGAIHRIINLNWLIILLGVSLLFTLALIYLDLGALILSPSTWFDCPLNRAWRGNSWIDFSHGLLRPTAVGRFAALAGIIALGNVWTGRWRLLWSVILAVAFILLLTSGARGAYFGFAAAGALIIVFYGGKKAVLLGALGLIVLVPLFWSTGIHQQFFNTCIFRSERLGSSPTQQPLTPRVTVPQDSALPEQTQQPLTPQLTVNQDSTVPDQTQQPSSPQLTVPQESGPQESAFPDQTQQPSTPQLTVAQESGPQVSAIPGSVLIDLPFRIEIPRGNWILEEVLPSEQNSPGVYNNTVAKSESQDGSSVSTGKPLLKAEQAAPNPLTRVLVPVGRVSESILPIDGPGASDRYSTLRIPVGVWNLKHEDIWDERQRLRVPVGFLIFERLAPGAALDPARLVTGPRSALVTLSGRTSVWAEGLRLFKERPIMGYGFHADRLLLGTHMHNSFIHALVQTGLAGTIPFITAFLFAWLLLIKALRNRATLPRVHRHLLIQVAAIMVFFSLRTIPESTGAFFGIDWILLAPILAYLQVVNQAANNVEVAP